MGWAKVGEPFARLTFKLPLSYGKEGCARVKSKIVFLAHKLFIIIMVEYTLEQHIFLYDTYVKYSSARLGGIFNVSLHVLEFYS